jgi:DNA-binding HxlR family transcriptional regulator
MDYLDLDTSNCSVGRTMAIVGQSWVILILREVSQGVRRFKDIQDHLGISRSVLSERLDSLVEHGILELRTYQEPGQRARSAYHLTRKGRDLYPAITALREWGDKYLADPAGPSTLVRHRDCGALVHTQIVCEAGHVVAPEDLRRGPGPGARLRTVA